MSKFFPSFQFPGLYAKYTKLSFIAHCGQVETRKKFDFESQLPMDSGDYREGIKGKCVWTGYNAM